MQFAVHEKMPFTQYNALPGLRSSSLKHALVSGLEYQAKAGAIKDSDTLRMGRAGHTAVLEMERFLAEYAQFETKHPDGSKRIRSGGAWEDFKATNATKTILTPEQFADAMSMRDAVRDHPIAGPLVKGLGRNELSLVWSHGRTKETLKARLDRITRLALIDIKTSHDISPESFQRTAIKLGYFMQLSMYSDGAEACGLGSLPVKIVAVQNAAPFDVAVYDVESDALDYGRERYNQAIDTVLRCRKENKWPGFATEGTLPLGLPLWMQSKGETVSFNGVEI